MSTPSRSCVNPLSPDEITYNTVKVLKRVLDPLALHPDDRLLGEVIRAMARALLNRPGTTAEKDMALLLAVSTALADKR